MSRSTLPTMLEARLQVALAKRSRLHADEMRLLLPWERDKQQAETEALMDRAELAAIRADLARPGTRHRAELLRERDDD